MSPFSFRKEKDDGIAGFSDRSGSERAGAPGFADSLLLCHLHPFGRTAFCVTSKPQALTFDLILSMLSCCVLDVCMISPCSQEPQQKKTCKRTEHSSSVPDQDRRFTSLGPRALKKLPTAPGVLEEGQSGMGKSRG